VIERLLAAEAALEAADLAAVESHLRLARVGIEGELDAAARKVDPRQGVMVGAEDVEQVVADPQRRDVAGADEVDHERERGRCGWGRPRRAACDRAAAAPGGERHLLAHQLGQPPTARLVSGLRTADVRRERLGQRVRPEREDVPRAVAVDRDRRVASGAALVRARGSRGGGDERQRDAETPGAHREAPTGSACAAAAACTSPSRFSIWNAGIVTTRRAPTAARYRLAVSGATWPTANWVSGWPSRAR